jgi:hypothetical protein
MSDDMKGAAFSIAILAASVGACAAIVVPAERTRCETRASAMLMPWRYDLFKGCQVQTLEGWASIDLYRVGAVK